MGTGATKRELSQRVELISGWIQDTMPDFKKRACRENIKLAFVHVDCDYYEPTKATLENIWDLLEKGGIVVVGTLNNPKLMGKTIAVEEFLRKLSGHSYEIKTRYVIDHGNQSVSTTYLRKM